MIKAHKVPAFEFVFELYNRWLLRRRFDSIFIKGASKISDGPYPHPLVFCLNHSSWWDGLVAYLLSRKYRFDGYWMMEEKQLRNLRPFTWLGAFSVVRENAREAAAALRYAVERLTEKTNRALWVFPQGKILPNDHRPISCFPGAMKIAEKTEGTIIIPIALRYEFLGNYKPSIFIAVGNGLTASEQTDLQQGVEVELTALLDEMRAEIATGKTENFSEILRKG